MVVHLSIKELAVVNYDYMGTSASMRERLWRPTPAWEQAWRENLARAPRLRSPEESWRIKQAVRDWLAAPPEQRPAQQDLARELGVSKQYVNRLVHRLPPAVPYQTEAAARPAQSTTPAHIAARDEPRLAVRCPRCNVILTTWPCLWCAARH